MNKIWVIFKKEVLVTLRDRRTVIFMVIMPLFLLPLLLNLVTSVRVSQEKKARQKIIRVGLLTNGNGATLKERLGKRQDLAIEQGLTVDEIKEKIRQSQMDFALVIRPDFDQRVQQRESGLVDFYYKSSSENDITRERIDSFMKEYREQVLDDRLDAIKMNREFIEPVRLEEHDLATVKEQLGERIGGLLPYIFVIFCFTGAMYTAIDLAAGEKEKATLETLLTSPVSRMQIVTGKFLVVVMAGLTSAVLSILSVFISVKTMRDIPQDVLGSILKIIEWKSIALLLSLLIPLCVFFAALQLAFSLYAKSFKEAQSIMTPMSFVVIVPVVIGLVPGIKLNTLTAWVPILNVSLASKEIVSGTIQWLLLAQVYVSLIVLAFIGLKICHLWFKKESIIFRGI